MKISVVTLSFNQGAFLERAMKSVLDQDYPDVEYIIVDPGSTDGSRAIIERYRERTDGRRPAVLLLDPDDGPADGLNRGLAAATGEVFAFINADDYLLPGAISTAMAAFKARPDCDVAYGHGCIEDSRQGRRRVFATAPITPWRWAYGGAFLLQQASFYRTEAIRSVGGFNPQNKTCWDGELIGELLLSGKVFCLVPKELAVFVLHDSSITGSGRLHRRYLEDWARISHRLTGRGADRFDPLRRLWARALKWAWNPRALAVRLGLDGGGSAPQANDPS